MRDHAPTAAGRLSTGIEGLDHLLGGGLLPGTLTVLSGTTGIGKTQFGLHFLRAGLAQEGRSGVVFDMSSRGDAQGHAAYAQRLFDWSLSAADPDRAPSPEAIFDRQQPAAEYLHVFDYQGRRMTRGDLDSEGWQDWQAELARKLTATIAFFYGNFTRGVRRAVIDGIEPVERPSDSIQFELFEYVYHQILRKDHDWVARDLLRERFRTYADAVQRAAYDPRQIGCLLLYTSPEAMLDELIERKLDEGDALANANTLIYLGKVREGNRMGRALYIAKHRGSACSEEIVPYTIDEGGLRLH
ncbi:MAG TPA: ATPase domain-containing protein [Pirellulales bacterium]|nr:ATPase domain-containing protein [Pirellulales bacterium]